MMSSKTTWHAVTMPNTCLRRLLVKEILSVLKGSPSLKRLIQILRRRLCVSTTTWDRHILILSTRQMKLLQGITLCTSWVSITKTLAQRVRLTWSMKTWSRGKSTNKSDSPRLTILSSTTPTMRWSTRPNLLGLWVILLTLSLYVTYRDSLDPLLQLKSSLMIHITKRSTITHWVMKYHNHVQKCILFLEVSLRRSL